MVLTVPVGGAGRSCAFSVCASGLMKRLAQVGARADHIPSFHSSVHDADSERERERERERETETDRESDGEQSCSTLFGVARAAGGAPGLYSCARGECTLERGVV